MKCRKCARKNFLAEASLHKLYNFCVGLVGIAFRILLLSLVGTDIDISLISRCSAVILIVAVACNVELAALDIGRAERLVDMLEYPVHASLIVCSAYFHTLARRQHNGDVRIIHPLAASLHELSRFGDITVELNPVGAIEIIFVAYE